MNSKTNQKNPYVGPYAFTIKDPLYGRDRERRNLLDLLIAERLVMLYSPSGAGKTSLIQAALIPDLEEEGFNVLPVIRVSREPQETTDNRYILSTLRCLEEPKKSAESVSKEQLTSIEGLTGEDMDKPNLVSYLDKRQSNLKEAKHTVFIFDQFEEILTVDPTDQDKKIEFFTQLGKFLQDRNRWALFALREDHIAGLDPFLHLIPTRLKTTFRLNLLEKKAALDAIQRPAENTPVRFDTKAADELVKDLLKEKFQQPNGTFEEKDGFYVEPVQLQVVCRRLWGKKLAEGTEWIKDTDIESGQTVDEALSAYYNDQVQAIVVKTKVDEITIRDWFDQQLITPQGIRSQVQKGQGQNHEFEDNAIPNLIDAHLVRSEKRNNITWYEVAHDRLIKPIQEANRKWRDDNLTTLQRQAINWDKAGRLNGLLLLGAALKKAAAEPKRVKLSKNIDDDFLNRCLKKQKQVLIFRLWIIASILVLLLITVLILSLYIEAKTQEVEAKTQTLIAKTEISKSLSSTGQIQGLVFAVEAVGLSHSWFPKSVPPAQVRSSLLLAIQQIRERNILDITDTMGTVYAIAINAENQILYGTISILKHYSEPVQLWSQDGKKLGDFLENPNTNESSSFYPDNGVNSLAISANFRVVAVEYFDSTIQLRSKDGKPLGKPFEHPGTVTALAVSADGQTLVSGSDDGKIQLWSKDGKTLGEPFKHPGGVTALAVSADGQTIISGGHIGTIRQWSRDLWPLGKPFIGTDDKHEVIEDNNKIQEKAIENWLQDCKFFGDHSQKSKIKSVYTSADQQTLITVDENNSIQAWSQDCQSKGKAFRHTVELGPIGVTRNNGEIVGSWYELTSLIVSTDGQTIITVNNTFDLGGFEIIWWSPDGNPLGKSFKHDNSDIKVSADGLKLVSEDKVWLMGDWETWLGKACDILRGHSIWVKSEKTKTEQGAVKTCKDHFPEQMK